MFAENIIHPIQNASASAHPRLRLGGFDKLLTLGTGGDPVCGGLLVSARGQDSVFHRAARTPGAAFPVFRL
jgi:hypothetical protein